MFRLTVNTENAGSVQRNPDFFYFSINTVVELAATPDPGWAFDEWDGDVANTGSAITSITMNSDKTVTAIFAEDSDNDGMPDEGAGSPNGIEPTYDGSDGCFIGAAAYGSSGEPHIGLLR